MKKFTVLSNDIENKDLIIDLEKVKDGEYEIESIIDIIYKDDLNESNLIGAGDLSNKDIKRGSELFITCMLRKQGTTSFSSPSIQGVVKVRVVDIFFGLSMLNKVINK